MLRKSFTQLPDEAAHGQYFSERYRVNPYDRRALERAEPSRNLSHAFGKTTPVFPVAQDLVKPVGRAYHHGQRQHEAVEEIAQVDSF